MQASDFKEVAPGRLVRTPGGYWGFVPERLPPQLQWDAELISILSADDRALGCLSRVDQIRCLIREAGCVPVERDSLYRPIGREGAGQIVSR